MPTRAEGGGGGNGGLFMSDEAVAEAGDGGPWRDALNGLILVIKSAFY